MTDARQDNGAAWPDLATLDEQRAGDEIADLSARIARANQDYHTLDAPVLSDAEYDALKQRLLALERAFPQLARPDSPTQVVGAAPAEGFGKVVHAQRMMSLENGFSAEDVSDFVSRVRSFLGLREGGLAFTAEPKIDGLSLSLRYEDGVLVHVVPQDQLVEAAPAGAAAQIDGGIVRALAAQRHTLSATAHTVRELDAPSEAGAPRDGQAAAHGQTLEDQPGRRRTVRAASDQQKNGRKWHGAG